MIAMPLSPPPSPFPLGSWTEGGHLSPTAPCVEVNLWSPLLVTSQDWFIDVTTSICVCVWSVCSVVLVQGRCAWYPRVSTFLPPRVHTYLPTPAGTWS